MGDANEGSAAQEALSRLARLIRHREQRYSVWMRRGLVKGAFQSNNDTQEDRYPAIFDFVQAALGAQSAVNLLSFGCSTGEEVFTLSRRFPNATLRGLDINPGNIDICRRRLRERRVRNVSFDRANSTLAEPAESYDGIFCMAVLRDGRLARRQPPDCSALIRFDAFARLLDDFHRCLKPGGLLVIRHSNFRLRDAPIGPRFEVLLSLPVPPQARSPLYDRDNRLIAGEAYPDAVFRKLTAQTPD